MLFTLDVDFADIRAYPPSEYPSLSALLDRLASLVAVNPPATEESIDAVERRLRIRMTSDFREVYLRLNGTADGTPLENGWFELWSLTRWYTVDEYVRDWPAADQIRFKDIGGAIVFADYSIESWHYAVHFSRDSTMPTAPIYLLHLQPYFVAKSLRAFLAAALVDGPAFGWETSGCSMTLQKRKSKSSQSSRRPKRTLGSNKRGRPARKAPREVALAQVKDDLSKYLRQAAEEAIVITRHGKPAGVLIGFASEDDWFEYRLEHHPEFLRRIQQARADIREGRGVPLKNAV